MPGMAHLPQRLESLRLFFPKCADNFTDTPQCRLDIRHDAPACPHPMPPSTLRNRYESFPPMVAASPPRRSRPHACSFGIAAAGTGKTSVTSVNKRGLSVGNAERLVPAE